MRMCMMIELQELTLVSMFLIIGIRKDIQIRMVILMKKGLLNMRIKKELLRRLIKILMYQQLTVQNIAEHLQKQQLMLLMLSYLQVKLQEEVEKSCLINLIFLVLLVRWYQRMEVYILKTIVLVFLYLIILLKKKKENIRKQMELLQYGNFLLKLMYLVTEEE